MSKSRSFSIYLLKQGFDAGNSLKENHALEKDAAATSLPQGSSLYILDRAASLPWWSAYFGIQKPLKQATKGAIVFVTVNDRCFALSFGHVYHKLKEESYEYDFGLRVTLNSLDPNQLKSTDILEPGAARRRRTQSPVGSDITYFDFDRDSTMLKSLTGKIKPDHRELFKHATGASNLRISSDVAPDQLIPLCEQCLKLYESEEYKIAFPDIQNISPLRDPSVLSQLDAKLITAFQDRSDGLSLTVPDLINYHDDVYARFSGAGRSARVHDEVFIAAYYEYLDDRHVDPKTVGISELKNHSLLLTDGDGSVREKYSIHKCLIFDTPLNGSGSYHLCEGQWYKVETKYIKRIQNYLDPLCRDLGLPAYEHGTEGEYNKSVSVVDSNFICLDTTNISPIGEKQVEPCDLYRVEEGAAVLFHIKISTLSKDLSHLFNQGVNSVELIRLEQEARDRFKALLLERPNGMDSAVLTAPVDSQNLEVAFGIITHKDSKRKSENLPLFSRISLMRNVRALQLMGVPAWFGFVEDRAKLNERKKKPEVKDLAIEPQKHAA